jgi:hypothetical protein
MAVLQDQVNQWFADNPNAKGEDVVAAIQGAGGLDAHAGLTDILASRYGVAPTEIQNYYATYAAPAPTGALMSNNTAATGNVVTTTQNSGLQDSNSPSDPFAAFLAANPVSTTAAQTNFGRTQAEIDAEAALAYAEQRRVAAENVTDLGNGYVQIADGRMFDLEGNQVFSVPNAATTGALSLATGKTDQGTAGTGALSTVAALTGEDSIRHPNDDPEPINLDKYEVRTVQGDSLGAHYDTGHETYGPDKTVYIDKATGKEITEREYRIGTGQATGVDTVATQILGQGLTDQWQGAGYGSVDANAEGMARILNDIGIKDINDFGLVDKYKPVDVLYETYNGQRVRNQVDEVTGQQYKDIVVPTGETDWEGNQQVRIERVPDDANTTKVYGTVQSQWEGDGTEIPVDPKDVKIVDGKAVVKDGTTYGNKKTGQAVPNTYGERQVGNAWGGTYAGKGNTAFRVDMSTGKPIFYTTGASSSSVAEFAPLLAMASFIPGVAPFAQAINAAIAIDNGDPLGALASLAGMGGYTDVATAANVAKAVDTGNFGALAGALLSNPNVSEFANTTMLTDTISLADVGNGANVALNLADGNVAGVLSSAGALTGSSDLKVAAAGATIVQELGKENPNFGVIAGAVNSIDQATSGATRSIDAGVVGGITNRVVDDLVTQSGETDIGSAAYISAINAGASEVEAMDAANAVTGAASGSTGTADVNGVVVNKVADAGPNTSVITDGSGATTVTGAAGNDTVTGANAVDTEFGNLQGAINTNAMDDAVRADKLNVISTTPKFADAYSQARELLGAGKTFEWNGKTYSTDTRAENPVIAAASDATRLDNIAASTTAGGGRGSYLGYNSAEDAASKANLTVPKTNELLGYINDDQGGGYDALGNPIGGQTIGASADLSTTSGKIANGVANAMTTFLGGVANMPVAGVQAIGNLTSNVGGIIDLVSGGPTEAGNKLRDIASQVETFTSSISDPQIKAGQQAIGTAIDKADGLIGKAAALATSAYENPLGAANWVFTEAFEEVPGVGIALKVGRALGAGTAASKAGVLGTTIANDMVESGGAAYNETYKEALKTMPEAEARIAARNASLASMAVTGVTQGIVEGKVVNKVLGRETAGEFTEGALQSGATQLALGQDLSVDKMLTQGVIEAGVGKGASTTAAGVTATNIGTGSDATTTGATNNLGAVGATVPGGTSTGTTTNNTDLGSVGAETPGASTVTGNDLGAIGSVTPGADAVVGGEATVGDTAVSGDTSTADITNSVTTQIGSGADAGVVVGDTVTGAISAGSNASTVVGSSVTAAVTAGGNASTVVGSSVTAGVTAGADASTVVGSSVTAAVTAGADASTVVGSAVTAATTAGASVDSSIASSVSAAVAAGSNATTAVTAAADAAIAAGNNVTVATDADSTTVTNATTNTTTTVNNTTGVATTVDANTNVTTTVDAATGTTTAVDANTNVTTQTTVNGNTSTTVVADANANINTQTVVDANTNTTTSTTVDAATNTTTQTTTDANTNTQTTVVTDVNTNTQITVKVNTNTGDVIEEMETVIPDGWTPPVIDSPEIPASSTPTSTSSSTPATKTASTAKLSKSGSGAAIAGGAMGLPSGFDMDPASLGSRVTQGKIDPLARVKEAQAELERDIMMNQIDPRLMSVMQQRMDPNQQAKQLDQDVGALAKMLRGESPNPSAPDSPVSANEGKYYSYGAEDSIDDILGGKAANYKAGGFVEPLKASGGMVLPLLAKSGGALGKYNGREDFKGGKHVAGEGDGQSDDIPAWLADGEFVFPADVVSALGNGSTKAGTDKLYEMMHGIRDRARSKGPKDLPPPALKSALDYLKSSKRSSK